MPYRFLKVTFLCSTLSLLGKVLSHLRVSGIVSDGTCSMAVTPSEFSGLMFGDFQHEASSPPSAAATLAARSRVVDGTSFVGIGLVSSPKPLLLATRFGRGRRKDEPLSAAGQWSLRRVRRFR